MEQAFLLTNARKAMLVAFLTAVPAFSLPSVADTLQSVNIQHQSGKVKGKVFDSNGEAVIGASVKIVGQKNSGTITDIDGNFTIDAKNGQTLEISYIGYKPKTVKVNGASLTVKLEDDAQLLNDVVVVGYGTMRKKDLTGSVLQINPEKFANENPGTVQDLLRGTPGLNVGYSADAKGGGSMQIRGQRSVYTDGGHNDPLIILDGMAFYGELSEINPDDIGQIDVLKDASAAAVYGAKAANGVIIVTTKKGKLGKPTVNVSANLGINTKSDYTMDIYSPSGYMKFREDWYKATTYGMGDDGVYGAYKGKDGKGNLIQQPGYYDTAENAQRLYGVDQATWAAYSQNADGESMASIYAQRLGLRDNVLQNYLDGNTVDWWDKTFRTGINQDYNASISGASETMNYYMSAGFLHNEGAVKGNEYRSIRANMKVSGKVTKWLEIGANVNFQDRSDGDITVGLGTNYWDNNQLRNSPFSTYRNEDGTLAQYPMNQKDYGGYSYDFERQYLDLEKGYQVLNTIFNAKVTLPFGITYAFNASPRYQYYYNRYFMSADRPNTNAQDLSLIHI